MRAEEFRSIYEHYSRKIYSYVLWMTRNRAASDDILQSVFLKVWKNGGGPSIEEDRTRWMYAVARNACLDFFRSFNRYSRFRIRYLRESETSCRDEHSKFLWELLENVSETDRGILYLHLKMGYRYEEIGRILSMSPGHVRVRAFRALKHLRTIATERGL
jgi:RNA polymerase sigma factor (sigma-70 family)